MDTPPEALRRSQPLPHWLLEGIFIVVSVTLGFGVSQCAQSRADRELATRALTSITAEIEGNLRILQPLVPIHREWATALAKADVTADDRSGLDAWFQHRPALPRGSTPFVFLTRSAWDATLAGGALRFIDYDVATSLSEIYRAQEIATENVERLTTGPMSSADTFDPARRAASVRMLWLTLADILAAEEALLERYTRHLPAIRTAAGR